MKNLESYPLSYTKEDIAIEAQKLADWIDQSIIDEYIKKE
jgi:hypothetical protein